MTYVYKYIPQASPYVNYKETLRRISIFPNKNVSSPRHAFSFSDSGSPPASDVPRSSSEEERARADPRRIQGQQQKAKPHFGAEPYLGIGNNRGLCYLAQSHQIQQERQNFARPAPHANPCGRLFRVGPPLQLKKRTHACQISCQGRRRHMPHNTTPYGGIPWQHLS